MSDGRLRLFFRQAGLLCVLIAAASCLGCGRSRQRPEVPNTWTTGFWFWNGSSASVTAGPDVLDSIFCYVGTISLETWPAGTNRWTARGGLPETLPPAREYWLVFRYDTPGVPAPLAAAELARAMARLKEDANRRELPIAGIQLDIDSPTRLLPEYAAFLRELRKSLQPGTAVSITALLDWFRSGTAASEVIAEVDEFVPQFYDVQERNSYQGGFGIAAPMDAAKWGTVFNRFRKRFRIGISSFGRSRLVRSGQSQNRRLEFSVFADLTPLDLGADPAFELRTSRTDTQELLLSYRPRRSVRIGYTDLQPGDTLEFILPTPDAIGAAVAQAKRMGGYCAGVVFFRWPQFNEVLAAQPDQVLRAAGALSRPDPPVDVRAIDGECAAVHCVDLYLVNASPLVSEPIRYNIDSSAELEYFMPREGVPVRMSGPSRIELLLPPHGGRSRIYLGRAVTMNHAEFRVGEQP